MIKLAVCVIIVVLMGCDRKERPCSCYHHTRCNNYSKFHNINTCPVTLQEMAEKDRTKPKQLYPRP